MFVCAISTNINFDLFTFQINTNATALTEAEEERPLCFSICLCLISFNFDLFTFQISTSAAAALQAWQQKLITGPWMLEKEFGQEKPGSLSDPFHGSVVNPTNGNVVVLATNDVQIFSSVGEYRFSKNVPQSDVYKQIAVSSDGNTYFMTLYNEFVQMYDNNCKFKSQWVSSYPEASSLKPCLLGLAINNKGQVLVGDVMSYHINIHKQDGSYISSIKVDIEPEYLAVTSQDTIVVAGHRKPPQIVSNTGQVLYTLKHPTDDTQWLCFGAYCYRDTIFITNLDKSKAWELLCYTESGQYLGCLPIPDARCCAMMQNGTKIIVGKYNGCAIYSLRLVWTMEFFMFTIFEISWFLSARGSVLQVQAKIKIFS